jgi:hypothetical protein
VPLAAAQVAKGLRERPTPEQAAGKGLISADVAPALEDAEQLKHEAMKRRQDIISAQVGGCTSKPDATRRRTLGICYVVTRSRLRRWLRKVQCGLGMWAGDTCLDTLASTST